jgi:hypothetical protein
MKFVDINSLSHFLKNLKNIFEPKGSLDAAKVYTDDAVANLTADDIGVYVQSEEPADAVEGDIWVDVDAESHLDPEIVIDSTLSVSGAAADAKVVGDKIDKINSDKADISYVDAKISTEKSERQTEIAVERARINTFTALADGSTTGDAELQDIRVGYDGVVYDTAGEAIRGQVAQLSSKTDDVRKAVLSSSTTNGTLYHHDSSKFKSTEVELTADNNTTLTFKGKNLFYSVHSYMQKGVTKSANGNVISFSGTSTQTSGTVTADMPCYIPAGKVYVMLQSDAELLGLSLRKSDLSSAAWLSDDAVSGNVYKATLTEPAHYLRCAIALKSEEYTEADDVRAYIGYEPLADGEDIPDAQIRTVSTIKNVATTEDCFLDGCIYTTDGTIFTVTNWEDAEKSLPEINVEISSLKEQVDNNMNKIGDIKEEYTAVNLTTTSGRVHQSSTEGETISFENPTFSHWRYAEVNVSSGEVYKITLATMPGYITHAVLTDIDGYVIKNYITATTSSENIITEITIPSNGYKLYLSRYAETEEQFKEEVKLYKKGFVSIQEQINRVEEKVDNPVLFMSMKEFNTLDYDNMNIEDILVLY